MKEGNISESLCYRAGDSKDKALKSPEVADPEYLPIIFARASPTMVEPLAHRCVWASIGTVPELLSSWFGFLKGKEKGKKKKEKEDKKLVKSAKSCFAFGNL